MAYDLNAALQQYNYNNSTPQPGETGQAFYARKSQEYMSNVAHQNTLAQNIHQMQANQEATRQYEAALEARGLWSPSQSRAEEAENDAKLERERQLAFGALNRQANFYDQGSAAELEQRMLGDMRGQNNPFSPDIVNNLVGRETDADAAQVRAEQNMIRSRMANSGMGGSGIAARAQLEAQRAASKRTRRSSIDIRTKAQLDNAQHQERAQQRHASLVAQKAANRAATTRQEVELRSRMQVLGDDRGMDKLAEALTGGGVQQLPMQTIQRSGSITGNNANKSQYGGVTWLNGSGVNPFMQTSGGVRGNNMGLGGRAGPFPALSRMSDNQFNRPTPQWGQVGGERPQFSTPSFGGQSMSPQAGVGNGYGGFSSQYQNAMNNPFAPQVGSSAHKLLMDSLDRGGRQFGAR